MLLNVLVVFGGRSTEHEVSIMSCRNVCAALDSDKYNVYKVFITKEGLWKYWEGSMDSFSEEEALKAPDATLLCGAPSPALLVGSLNGNADDPDEVLSFTRIHLDVAIPVLHGLNGEDGTIQGLFEIARLPYVGSGVLGSAVSMDKITTKRIIEHTPIRQAKYVTAYTYEFEHHMNDILDRAEKALSYPIYVKPANAGSSVGVSKAKDRGELEKALREAGKVDSRLLMEETIAGREVECAVLGNVENAEAAGVGEILAADTFYTYDAKYNNADSKTVLDPDLPEDTVQKIREDAVEIFRMVNASGLARVDFFVEKSSGDVVFNEINTLPGFTNISMWPMLWKHQGMPSSEQLDVLIVLALARMEAEPDTHRQ